MSNNTRIVENENLFRKNVVTHLNNLLFDNKKAINLEKGIYNYTIKYSIEKNILKQWQNKNFVLIYLQKLKSITFNLKNQEILNDIKNNKYRVHELAFMTHYELRPDIWNNLIELKKTTHTITFKCISNDIYSKEITFGNIEDDNGDSTILYEDTFNTETFYKIMKLSGVCKNIFIYAKHDFPLYIKNKLGDIGDISILIKSNNMMKK